MQSTWKCGVCGYVHSGSTPPESCPICGAEQQHFSPLIIRTGAPVSDPVGSSWQCSICDHIAPGKIPPDTCPVCSATKGLFHPYLAAPAPAPQAAQDVRRIVILGAGIAGLTAAEEARRQAPAVEITLISRELSLPYYRLNLTRFLAGEVTEGDLIIHHQDWFASQKIDFLAGEATEIDRKQRCVTLGNGMRLGYDRLILANGAHPFIPPIPGSTRDGVMVLRNLGHAREIISRLRPGARVTCLGGGLLGLECAGALLRRGAEVTVLEGFDWLLPRQLPPAAAALLSAHLQKLQMTIECGVKVKEFTGDEAVRGVLLEDGREFAADLVILAAGVRPNSHLARQCGLKARQGVLVDDRLLTSDPYILAAGDVTEHQGRVYGIWPASYAQGLVAGANAAGSAAEFPGLPMTNRIKVLDVDLFSIGEFQAGDASLRLLEVSSDGNYRGLACRDGQAVGGVLYGDMSLVEPVREGVEQGLRIQELSALHAHFPGLQTLDE